MVVEMNGGDNNNVDNESDEWDDNGDYLTMVEVMVMVVLMVLVVKCVRKGCHNFGSLFITGRN